MKRWIPFSGTLLNTATVIVGSLVGLGMALKGSTLLVAVAVMLLV